MTNGTGTINRKLVLLVGALLLLTSAALALSWNLSYLPGDPKNLAYRLWKAGFASIDLDLAADTMIGDAHRDELVVGKTKTQLEKKFGYMLAREQVTPYLRGCSQAPPWRDRDVSFIRKSPWMVVFDGDKATELVLIKGC